MQNCHSPVPVDRGIHGHLLVPEMRARQQRYSLTCQIKIHRIFGGNLLSRHPCLEYPAGLALL